MSDMIEDTSSARSVLFPDMCCCSFATSSAFAFLSRSAMAAACDAGSDPSRPMCCETTCIWGKAGERMPIAIRGVY